MSEGAAFEGSAPACEGERGRAGQRGGGMAFVVGDLNQSGGVTKLRVKKENYAYPVKQTS